MAQPVLMPQAGQSMTEGKIVEWVCVEGDEVKRGDPLLVIETDKANMDVESPASGVLRKVFYAEGDVVPILKVVAVIGAADEEIDFDALASAEPEPAAAASEAPIPTPAAAPKPSAPAPAVAPKPAPAAAPTPMAPAASLATAAPALGSRNGGRLRSSPLARRLARSRGIDLRTITGSGPQGRIIRRDVEAAASAPAAAPVAPVSAALAPASASKPYPPPSPRPPAMLPLEGMRKAISTALQRSSVQAPHFYLSMKIDVTAALELRRQLEAQGNKVSVNDLIVKAVALALVDEPRVNCRVSDDQVDYPSEINIGIAVGLDDGLVVPVVVNAQERDLAGIAAESKRIVEASREGKLIGSGQGTFTISNLGMFGVDSFTAVINPPEGAILAVGAATPRLVPMAGGFFPRSILKATLSSDHRAIDGMLAAKFMARVRHLLENPDRLV